MKTLLQFKSIKAYLLLSYSGIIQNRSLTIWYFLKLKNIQSLSLYIENTVLDVITTKNCNLGSIILQMKKKGIQQMEQLEGLSAPG